MEIRPINLLAGATITHPTKGRIPFQPYEYQRRFWRDDATRRTVIHDRQVGVTTALMAEAVALCLTANGIRVAVVSPTMRQCVQAIQMAVDIYRGLPMRPWTMRQRGKTTLHFGNASELFAVSTLRSTAVNRVIIEDFPDLPDPEAMADEIVGAMGIGAQITVTGVGRITPDSAFGTQLDRMFASRSFAWSRHVIAEV